MATGTVRTVASCGGATIQKTATKSFDHPNNYEGITVPAGKAVTAWVMTDADTADCNLSANHGYSSGKMDVFWEVSGVKGMRYDVDGTVTNDALTLDGGSGDNFPANATTGVVVCTPVQINTATDGDAIVMFSANCDQRASLYFEDSGDAEVAQIELQADEPYVYHDTLDVTNPLTGNVIAVCYATNGSTTNATLNILIGEDATP